MSKRFLISDMHFGHKEIISYENRPFQSVEEMDKTVIENWNRVVGHSDMIFILGDVSFYDKYKTHTILEQLKGRKFLILGNHDIKVDKHAYEFVSNYPIIIDDFYILSHEPVYLSESMPYVNIHGHLHNKQMSGNYVNVSVEKIGYTPINFDKIKGRFKNGISK